MRQSVGFFCPGRARPRAMTQRWSWIRFAAPAKVGSQTGIGLASGVLWPGAALETIEKRSPGSALPRQLPESVSRHLVSTSVQFGQSAAGKTESDQWPLAAHLLSEQLRNLRCRLSCCVGRPPPHDQGRNALLEQIWNTLLRWCCRHIAI